MYLVCGWHTKCCTRENAMTNTMRYTDEELAVIDGVIGWLYPPDERRESA